MALLEATELDHRDGRILNANMADYLVPVTADITALDATFLPGEDTLADPLGVKGLAELVFVDVPAAIANAVFNATGRRVTYLPITLDKLAHIPASQWQKWTCVEAPEASWRAASFCGVILARREVRKVADLGPLIHELRANAHRESSGGSCHYLDH